MPGGLGCEVDVEGLGCFRVLPLRVRGCGRVGSETIRTLDEINADVATRLYEAWGGSQRKPRETP